MFSTFQGEAAVKTIVAVESAVIDTPSPHLSVARCQPLSIALPLSVQHHASTRNAIHTQITPALAPAERTLMKEKEEVEMKGEGSG